MRDISTTLYMRRAIARQVCAAAPVQAQLAGKAVLVCLAVPTDELVPLVGRST